MRGMTAAQLDAMRDLVQWYWAYEESLEYGYLVMREEAVHRAKVVFPSQTELRLRQVAQSLMPTHLTDR